MEGDGGFPGVAVEGFHLFGPGAVGGAGADGVLDDEGADGAAGGAFQNFHFFDLPLSVDGEANTNLRA